MSLVPQAFSFPNLFFTYFKPSIYPCPRVLIYTAREHNPIMNLPWECQHGMRERAYFNDLFRVENKRQRNQWNFKNTIKQTH